MCIFDCHSQWGPAEVQPLVLSPNWWTCMPRSALGSLPVTSHVMVVGEDSDSCSKVTVPVTFESPRRVATTTESSGQHRPKEIHRATRTKRVIWKYMLVRKGFRVCLSGLRYAALSCNRAHTGSGPPLKPEQSRTGVRMEH